MYRVCTLPYAVSHRVELGQWASGWARGVGVKTVRTNPRRGCVVWAARALNEGKLGRARTKQGAGAMSRRQSSGVRKKQGAGANLKFKYELVRYTQEGNLTSLSEEELAEFKSAHAGFVAKWLTDASAEDAPWDVQCKSVLDTLMARPAAPRRHAPRRHAPPRPPTHSD